MESRGGGWGLDVCGLWPSSGPGMCGGRWGIALPLWHSAPLGILFRDFDTLNIYCAPLKATNSTEKRQKHTDWI